MPRLLAVLLLLALPLLAGADEIVWAVREWPPFFILKDGNAPASADELGDGVLDVYLRHLVRRLPQYQHRFETNSLSRIWATMKAGRNLCYPAALKNSERLEFAYFTPAMPTTSLAVVAKHGALDGVPHGVHRISLRELVSHSELTGVFVPQRSYGPVIDPLIHDTRGRGIEFDHLPDSAKLLGMLGAARMDYTLEYPTVVQYYMQSVDQKPDLDFFSIDEIMEEPPGYIACTRNAWGKRVIADLDRAAREAAVVPEVRDALGRWLPESVRRREKPGFEHFYDVRAQKSDIE